MYFVHMRIVICTVAIYGIDGGTGSAAGWVWLGSTVHATRRPPHPTIIAYRLRHDISLSHKSLGFAFSLLRSRLLDVQCSA